MGDIETKVARSKQVSRTVNCVKRIFHCTAQNVVLYGAELVTDDGSTRQSKDSRTGYKLQEEKFLQKWKLSCSFTKGRIQSTVIVNHVNRKYEERWPKRIPYIRISFF